MISHSKKFIFIHIPKTGGTSIEAVLADHGTVLQGAGNFHSIYFKHIDAKRLRVMMGAEYDRYFKFSIVRNPWDWLVSMYEFCRGFSYPFIYDTNHTIVIPEKYSEMPFDTWLDWFGSTFKMQQTDIISSIGGEIDVNKVYRFEELKSCNSEICKIFKIEKNNNLRKLKSSSRKSIEFYYRDKYIIKKVEKYFAKDIESFSYRFEDLQE